MKKKNLRVVCAWCTPPRPLDGLGPVKDRTQVTHTCCETCAVAFREQLRRYKAARGLEGRHGSE
jgi:hypothetical protein